MPRGKKTVFRGTCTECGARSCTLRILKAKKAEFPKLEKFCGNCRKRTPVKIAEEKHSS